MLGDIKIKWEFLNYIAFDSPRYTFTISAHNNKKINHNSTTAIFISICNYFFRIGEIFEQRFSRILRSIYLECPFIKTIFRVRCTSTSGMCVVLCCIVMLRCVVYVVLVFVLVFVVLVFGFLRLCVVAVLVVLYCVKWFLLGDYLIVN